MTVSTPDAKRLRRIAILGFFLLVVLHHLNGSTLEEGDAVPNVNLPIALVDRGRISFTPDDFPEMFKWKTKAPLGATDDLYFLRWSDVFAGKTFAEWRASGHLELNGNRYYIAHSPKQDVYVSTFGPLPGLLMLPAVAALHAFDDGIRGKHFLKLSISKLHGSACVALTAVLLLVLARATTSLRRSVLLALAYAVGTCAWAVSSQNAWQQSVSALFLTLGTFFLVRAPGSPRATAGAGVALSLAIASRPTSIIAFAAVAVYLALRHRRSLASFLLGGTPVVLAVAAHNFHYFGSPFAHAQELVGHTVAIEKTGSPDLWQTPFFVGLGGLLASPSRGLLFFSPILLLAFWGMGRIWRRPEWEAMRPLTVAVALMMAIQCKWFDWWGGWAYGYRPWLDVVPLLVAFILPVVDAALATRARTIAFGLGLGWSGFVQALGAFSYDRSWNNRTIFVVLVPFDAKPRGLIEEEDAVELAKRTNGEFLGPTFCDVDKAPCRHRLWSFEDSLVWYHLQHFWFTRGRRLPTGWADLGSEARR